MDLNFRISKVEQCLRKNNLTIAVFLRGVLQNTNNHCPTRELVVFNAADICADLYEVSRENVVSWAFDLVKANLCEEVVKLTQERNVLHFKASTAESDYLEGLFMRKAAGQMQLVSPRLWILVNSLLDANPIRRRAKDNNIMDTIAALGSEKEGDLGEIGGDDMNIDGEADEEEQGATQDDTEKLSKRRRMAASRNSALLAI